MSTTTISSPAEELAVADRNGTGSPARSLSAAIAGDLLYEVVDGKIREKEMGAREIEVAGTLFLHLGMFAKTQRLGRALMEFVFRIDAANNLQRRPDVAFVSHAKWPVQWPVPDVPAWEMIPNLAVEVVSPSNTADQVQEKIHEYFAAGVVAVWVVYPRQSEVYVYSSRTQIQVLQLGDELDGRDLVPGFRLPLAALFPIAPEQQSETNPTDSPSLIESR
jgi:Uma2 family endonuclease